MTLSLHPPGAALLKRVADRMNPLDVQEVLASCGHSPMQALEESVARSYEVMAACWNGEAHAVFGIATYMDNNEIGVPWLLATEEIRGWGREFLVTSRRFIERWQSNHELLTNVLDVRHHVAHRWLLWLGFEPTRLFPEYGFGKLPFIQFELCANQ